MFFRNYAKPGKGVRKRDPNEPRLKVFFDVFPRKLWDLFKLNLLYVAVSLPFIIITMLVSGVISAPIINNISMSMGETEIIGYDTFIRIAVTFLFMIFMGFGPITAGFSYIIREYACERPCWLISDFFERTKSNFKQGMLLWIIDLVLLFVFTVAYGFYGQSGNMVFQYIILLVSLVYIMMHIYIYQIMITFNLPLKHILKNSFLMTMGKAPINLLLLLCNIIVYLLIPILAIMSNAGSLTTMVVLMAEVLFLPAITNFIISFYIIPILNKHISDGNN